MEFVVFVLFLYYCIGRRINLTLPVFEAAGWAEFQLVTPLSSGVLSVVAAVG